MAYPISEKMFEADFEQQAEQPQNHNPSKPDTAQALAALKHTHRALNNDRADKHDIEKAIQAVVVLAQHTALELAEAEHRQKNRFNKKPKTADLSPHLIFADHGSNMAAMIHITLDHPELAICQHQLSGASGFEMPHQFVSVMYHGDTWVVDPSAKQFETKLVACEKSVSPKLEKFLNSGFFATHDSETATHWVDFYTSLDSKNARPQSFVGLLNTSCQGSDKLDTGEIEDAFVFKAQRIRRGLV